MVNFGNVTIAASFLIVNACYRFWRRENASFPNVRYNKLFNHIIIKF
ncbi:hypothetical protein SBF1_5760003 [Candidatus Desulfosporosinus infrequens]|uniref:Uncharacterized protein n=1 Tax=Candidatus Desulfosporosinus infrequens TaxID=2043169 RepID=A0A2U3LKW3_9FIRM|nr:hypothetical protein SBF1_5760003 [Candidatus Desulfosporosinus infrequens]